MYLYHDILIVDQRLIYDQHQVILLPIHSNSLHELLNISEEYLLFERKSNCDPPANTVVAKVEIIDDNHAAMITSLITLVVELAATNKRLVSQLAASLG